MTNDRNRGPFEYGDRLDDQAYEGADLYADDEDDEDDEDDATDDQHQGQHMRTTGTPRQGTPQAPGAGTIPGIPAIPVLSDAGQPQSPRQGRPPAPGSAPQSGLPVTVVAQKLRKDFIAGGEVVRAVDDVTFSLTTRQFVAITGPSGCGKTTLLYMLGSLERPSGGSVTIDGVDVTTLTGEEADRFRRKSIGFVFQSFHLIPNLTAMENVTLPMEIARVPRKDRRDRAAFLLQQVGLDKNRHHHLPSKLSGGQQQRVAIARALANDPAVILADEPTGNLDSANSKRLVSLLRTLARQGRTIVMVTHDRGIARLADVRMDLVDGRIVRMTSQGESAPNAPNLRAGRQTNTRNGPPSATPRW